ncbi:hypothetical protein C4Q26_20095 [Pseudomonas sp. SWI44]|nr:hypothetical protein C4Q26_20095 [Pseudomonas sp. SWI44]
MGYTLRDADTDEVMKYGETIHGERRHTQKYLSENNVYMQREAGGTKREMHAWQNQKIIEYKAAHGGKRPPLNNSDY